MINKDNVYHNEVLMQLFVQGPTWDGNLASKCDRDALVSAGLAERWDGWNFLTQEGVDAAVAGGMAARNHYEKQWYKKASNQ